MEKNKFTIFNFLRDSIHFLKIVIVFTLLLLLLYWVQNLIDSFWDWFKPINGIFEYLVNFSEQISSKSMTLINTEIEYKYCIAIFILLIFYAIAHLLYIGVDTIEDINSNIKSHIKKSQENKFNKNLYNEISKQEKKIKRYQIYIQARPKQCYEMINLNEQNQKLIKYLEEKTNIAPTVFDNGYLFEFDAFDMADSNLDIFSELISLESPLDYIVCVQVIDDIKKTDEQLRVLINLKIYNKIIMMSDTAYRYNFNNYKNYKPTSLGIYQNIDKTFEVHEFIRNL